MLILQRNDERRHVQNGTSDIWLTFYPREHADTLGEGFGSISILNETRLPPSEGVTLDPVGETELVTYVYRGALALDGPTGRSGVITAGEFQCMTIERVFRCGVTNASRTDPAHFFRIYLRMPPVRPGLDPLEVQTRFTAAQRRNVLCAVASPDGREASLRIHSDARIYSSILDQGQHIVYELPQGRRVWLHLIYGKGTVNGVDLTPGDGVGIAEEPSVSLTVRENSEMLMVDTIANF